MLRRPVAGAFATAFGVRHVVQISPSKGEGWGPSPPLALNVQIGDVQRVVLDELAAGLDLVAHQAAEEIVGLVGLAHPDLEERALLRIERRLPELAGIHFAEALVALERQPLPSDGENGGQKIARTVDDDLLILAHEAGKLAVDRLQLRSMLIELAGIGR